jgi:hypothetical protein
MKSLWSAIRETARIFGSHRTLWVPFVIVAVIQLALIGLVWLAPHPPFSKVLAPPIQYFFSDNMLHYPTHLWFMYHALKHAHLLASLVLGAYLTGIASEMVRQARSGQAGSPSLRAALVGKQVRYGRVTLLWLITWGLAKVLMELIATVAPKAPWVSFPAIGLLIMLQALLVYAIPAAVFAQAVWWKALWQSIKEWARYPFSTTLIVGVPSLVVVTFAILASPPRIASLMARTAPEMVLLFIVLRLAVLTLADAVMSVAVAHLWWIHRAEPVAQPVVPSPAPKAMDRGSAVA